MNNNLTEKVGYEIEQEIIKIEIKGKSKNI